MRRSTCSVTSTRFVLPISSWLHTYIHPTISITIVVLLALLVASVAAFLLSSPPGVGGAEPVEQAVDHGGVPGFNSQLDAFRAWAKLTWIKLQRPRSDVPRYDVGGNGIAGSAVEATKKSLEMGKETAEQAAASAGSAVAKDTGKGAAALNSDAEL